MAKERGGFSIRRRARTPGCIAFLWLGLVLLSGCGTGAQRGFSNLERYDMADFNPFRKLLIEDEFVEHPELKERTVYHLRFDIGDPPEEIEARARIRFTNRESEAIRQIPLFLYPNLTPGGLDVSRLKIDGVIVEPEFRESRSRLLIPAALEPGQVTTILVDYHLTLPVTEEGEYGGFGYSGGVFSLAYSYPIIPAYAGWNHPLPVPHGDFTFNEVSFYLVQVSMPEELVLAAPGVELAGRLRGGRREVTIAMGPARDLYLALSRDFVVHTEQAGKTEVRSFASAEGEPASRQALATAVAALRSYGDRFGDYPYKTLTLVSVPFAAFGLEFPGIIINSRRMYDLDKHYRGIPAPVLLESTTAHEVAHQWFYASIGNDQLLEPWLDEALTQYATWLYYRDRYGSSPAQGFFQSLYDRWDRVGRAEIPIGRPVGAYPPTDYGAIVYGRGPLFIQALSEHMGEEVFDSFLAEYARTFEWDIVDSREFKAAAEAACDCRLDDLFARWVAD